MIKQNYGVANGATNELLRKLLKIYFLIFDIANDLLRT